MMDSRPPKKDTASRQWKEKRLENGSRLLVMLTGPDGVCLTTYRYTGLSRAAAHKPSTVDVIDVYRRTLMHKIQTMTRVASGARLTDSHWIFFFRFLKKNVRKLGENSEF